MTASLKPGVCSLGSHLQCCDWRLMGPWCRCCQPLWSNAFIFIPNYSKFGNLGEICEPSSLQGVYYDSPWGIKPPAFWVPALNLCLEGCCMLIYLTDAMIPAPHHNTCFTVCAHNCEAPRPSVLEKLSACCKQQNSRLPFSYPCSAKMHISTMEKARERSEVMRQQKYKYGKKKKLIKSYL